MTLLPGDVILTGTPDGISPLADGDIVEVEIDGIGVLRNPVRRRDAFASAIAGAPSGDVHIGNIRTVLFNWLFARHEGGNVRHPRRGHRSGEGQARADRPRCTRRCTWLGLDWDEGPDVGGPHEPYLQSQRVDHHRELVATLEADGEVYRCYCTREDIKARGTATGYDRFCRHAN